MQMGINKQTKKYILRIYILYTLLTFPRMQYTLLLYENGYKKSSYVAYNIKNLIV